MLEARKSKSPGLEPKGLGDQGKTLRAMLEERDRITAETGHYYGLTSLPLHDADAVKMTRFNAQLTTTAVFARETAKHVAASPVMRSFGECLWMILRPEGDAVTASLGLIGHVQTAAFLVKSIVDMNYEGDLSLGLHEGDLISVNDPFYGGMHGADMYTFLPIFHEGELIAWAAAVNHVTDMGGALSPGGLPAVSTDVFTDGWQYPPVKMGQNFRIAKWWDELFMRRTRTGVFNVMDQKARVAGNKMIHDQVLKIVDDIGVNYFKQATKEIIERERRNLVRVLRRSTVPGMAQHANFNYFTWKGQVPPGHEQANKNTVLHRPVDFEINAEGRVHIDYTGDTSQGPGHNYHVWRGGVYGALSWWWFPQLHYGQCVNTAPNYQIDLKLREGAHTNPTDPFVARSAGVLAGGRVGTLFKSTQYPMLARGVLEEIGQTDPQALMPEFDGKLESGVKWGFGDFGATTGCSSTTARPYKDGESATTLLWNPQSDLGEIEEWELYMPPVVYLGKAKRLPNACGHGKFRGGNGFGPLYMIYKPGELKISGSAALTCAHFLNTTNGLAGGYPSYGAIVMAFRDTNIYELIERGEPHPTSVPEVLQFIREGKLKVGEIKEWGGSAEPIEVKHGDLYGVVCHAQGGYGDPLERRYELIKADLDEGLMTADVVSQVYGVMAERVGNTWKIDQLASEKLRKQAIQKRKERAVSAEEWWRMERAEVVKRDFTTEIKALYADVVMNSESFRSKFLKFWHLPEDFKV